MVGIMSEFLTQLTSVQSADQDYEWYPTTDEIIRSLTRSIKEHADDYRYDRHRGRSLASFLDIGAGNGIRASRIQLPGHTVHKPVRQSARSPERADGPYSVPAKARKGL